MNRGKVGCFSERFRIFRTNSAPNLLISEPVQPGHPHILLRQVILFRLGQIAKNLVFSRTIATRPKSSLGCGKCDIHESTNNFYVKFFGAYIEFALKIYIHKNYCNKPMKLDIDFLSLRCLLCSPSARLP